VSLLDVMDTILELGGLSSASKVDDCVYCHHALISGVSITILSATMSNPAFKILIAGGGIAGPCLAFWLSKTKLNIHVTVIERSPTPRVTGQAVDIRGRAVEIIQRMGLKEAVLAKNTTETGTAFVDSKGKIIAQFDADGDKSATSEFEILRADLATIFLGASSNLDNVEHVYAESIASLTQDDKGAHVTFTGGKTAEIFDLVVGADGQASKTRSLAFDTSIMADPYNPLGMYVAYFSIPRQPDDTKLWTWYTAPKGHSVMIRPHQNPSTVGAYLSVTMPSRAEKDPVMLNAMDQGNGEVKSLLHEYFADAGWQAKRVLEGMDAANDFYVAAWDQVKIPKWTNGRVVLVRKPESSHVPLPSFTVFRSW
jgi:2-polyprenyl-6-methoxyphenol hydroxylase-like FAD-dependent oxidoreductase